MTVSAALLTGCLSDDPGVAGRVEVEVLGEVVADGLDGPTQLTVDENGLWWLAQLGGRENEGRGQVVRLDPADPDAAPTVVLEALDKPTGVALFAGELWVMERNRLTRGPLDGAVDGSDRTVVADDLPTNGRSEGTLTVDGERLLYNTSGTLTDNGVPVADSGALWAVTADGDISELATGFKNAYAHGRSGNGTLYVTEIGDGRYDGERPDDELVPVSEGVDHGWPRCIGDNQPVAEYGGTPVICVEVPRSLAVFPPGATPTSVVAAPWDPELLLVALWNTGEVVAVPTDADTTDPDPTSIRVDYAVVFDGAESPQHLVADGDRVLLTDHLAGTIIALESSTIEVG